MCKCKNTKTTTKSFVFFYSPHKLKRQNNVNNLLPVCGALIRLCCFWASFAHFPSLPCLITSDYLFHRCFPAGLAALMSNSQLKEVCWSSHLLFMLFKAEEMPHYSPDRCISRDLSSIQNTSRLHNSVCVHGAACDRSVKALLSVENRNKPW